MNVAITISPRDYDVVLFDLDGVLTKSASVHAAAWKRLFDGFLEQRATMAGKPFVPFDIETDYPRYVDGKPCYDGVTDFLESRGIELPLGAPEDSPDVQSVHALGNLKDLYFLAQLKQHGVEPYAPAIALVHQLRAQEIKSAVVSSSNNCAAGLEIAGITDLLRRARGRDGHHAPRARGQTRAGCFSGGGTACRVRAFVCRRRGGRDRRRRGWASRPLRLRHRGRSQRAGSGAARRRRRRGVLLRCIRFEDGRGRQSTLKERRLVSMGSMHLGALDLALTAGNWSAGVMARCRRLPCASTVRFAISSAARRATFD